MIFIAHRGNVDGKKIAEENKPSYIEAALSLGYDVEVDIWHIDDGWFLGHDKPQYKIDISFLKNERLWCHAKNIQAFSRMLNSKIHCFWHQNDDITLTSRGYIWTYPDQELVTNSVCVMPEITGQNFSNCAAICSDVVAKYRHDT